MQVSIPSSAKLSLQRVEGLITMIIISALFPEELLDLTDVWFWIKASRLKGRFLGFEF